MTVIAIAAGCCVAPEGGFMKVNRLSLPGLLLVGAAMLLIGPVTAVAREVTCESRHMRHEYCPIGEHGDVRVMTAYGSHPCIQGQSWGTDGSGIWVDRGCYAKFWVDDKRSSHSNRNTAIAAGIGIAAIAAAIASQNHDRQPGYVPPPATTPPNTYYPPQPNYGYASVPSAQVGRFHGFNTVHRADITVDIDPSGRVMYYAVGQQVSGRLSGNRIYYDNGTSYALEPTGSGFVLRQDGDPNNATAFQRVR
jgi:hypothetical protein